VGRNSSRRSETDLTIPCASFEFLMRVLFIQNNGIQESIGVANPSGILKANGHETDLLLVSHTNDLIGAIKRSDPGLIAFSALTGVHHSLEQLAVTIKQHLNIPIIIGGPHPTYSPDMINSPGIDIICRGEGELAMLDWSMRWNTAATSRRFATFT
jgi:B12 binding domain